MIDQAELDAYIQSNGPWLFHGTDPENLPMVLEQGIRPGSELGRSNTVGFHCTRPGHVYLSHLEHCRRLQEAGDLGKGTIRVDLRELDPTRIDPDEDMVQIAWHSGDAWIASIPPFKDPGWEAGPKGENTLAYWAEHTPGFDSPAVTARSLDRGRISYLGTVPPASLAEITL